MLATVEQANWSDSGKILHHRASAPGGKMLPHKVGRTVSLFALVCLVVLAGVQTRPAAQTLGGDNCASPADAAAMRRCNQKNVPPPPPPSAQPTAGQPNGGGASETVGFDPKVEEQKQKTRNAERYRDPGAVSLCSPPYHMTAMDGCQR